MKPLVSLVVPATLLFCVAQTSVPVEAQTPPVAALRQAQPLKVQPLQTQPLKADALLGTLGQGKAIRIRNVSSDVMAYWLDPVHNKLPASFQIAVESPKHTLLGNPMPLPGWGTGKSLLPGGVTQVVSIAPQNIIIAFGNTEAIQRLEDLLTVLDRPIPQVEVEMHIVQVNEADAPRLFADPTQGALAAPNQIVAGSVLAASDWFRALTELQIAGKAKVLMAPRLLGVNNMPTEIKTLQGRQADVRLKEPGADAALNQALENLDAPVTASIGMMFRVTPTVNEDKTISLDFRMARDVSVGVGTEAAVPVATLSEVKSTMRVRDGETFVIRGQKAAMFDSKAANPEAPVLVFVKTTLIRRVGDER
jgi:type II secretory pathway component GspD/PulD (secretin)